MIMEFTLNENATAKLNNGLIEMLNESASVGVPFTDTDAYIDAYLENIANDYVKAFDNLGFSCKISDIAEVLRDTADFLTIFKKCTYNIK